jgi:hypothetical protein
MGDEREKRQTEDPDVEAHSKRERPIDTPDEKDDDDKPDVEAHHHKAAG